MAKKVGPAFLKPEGVTGQFQAVSVIRKESAHSIMARENNSQKQAGYMNASFTSFLSQRRAFTLQFGAGPYMTAPTAQIARIRTSQMLCDPRNRRIWVVEGVTDFRR